MKKIAILGSTGSIGTQTLEIVRNQPDLQVVSLAAGTNTALMEQQIREFRPRMAAMWSEEAAADLAARVADLDVKIVSGMDGLLEISTLEEAETLVTAIVGMIGIRPTIAAIEQGKTIALANKETLVTAGHLIMPLAKKHGVSILPVDSEHSAIFQSLHGENRERVNKIILTASGGPFRGRKKEVGPRRPPGTGAEGIFCPGRGGLAGPPHFGVCPVFRHPPGGCERPGPRPDRAFRQSGRCAGRIGGGAVQGQGGGQSYGDLSPDAPHSGPALPEIPRPERHHRQHPAGSEGGAGSLFLRRPK